MSSNDVVTFFCPGKAAPQGSKRHVGGGVMLESSKELGPWRQALAWTAHAAMKDAAQIMFDGAVAVTLEFVLPRPKSTPKTTPAAIKRPDLDKLIRAVLDGITNVILRDDSQVVELVATKKLAEIDTQPGVYVEVVRLT